jgi:hypothetical protein
MNLKNRITAHRYDKEFDQVSLLHIHQGALLTVEGDFIKEHNPKYNSQLGRPFSKEPTRTILHQIRWTKEEWQQIVSDAKMAGKKVGDWQREVLLEAARLELA